MKHLLVFLLLLCSASVSAQDVIVKKDGSTILSKVLEVGQEEIKYKKHDNLEGPTYIIQKSELQAINYQNGAKDTFSAPIRDENRYLPNNQNDGVQQYNDRALLRMDYAASNPYKKVKTLKTIGWIGGGILFATGCLFLSSTKDTGDKGWLMYYGDAKNIGLSSILGAGIWTSSFLLAANQKKKKIDKQLYSTSIIQCDLPLSEGSSLSLGADLLRDNLFGHNNLGLGLRYNF